MTTFTPGQLVDENDLNAIALRLGTSVADLDDIGAPSDGTPAKLRIGSSPHEFIGLVWDATYDKWVTPLIGQAHNTEDAALSSGSTTYATFSIAPRLIVKNFKAIYDAGLRMEAFCSGVLQNSGANTTFLRVGLFDFDDGDTGVSTGVVGSASEITHVGATATAKISGWGLVSGTPTQTHGTLIAEVKVSAGTGSWAYLNFGYRFVSA